MKVRALHPWAGFLAVAVLVGGFTYAQEMAKAKSAPAKGSKVTLTGQVIDISCWVAHGLKGAKHKECAEICSNLGVPLAILADNGSIYLPVSPDMPGSDQNEKLVPYAEETVVVEGTVFDRNGLRGVIIESVKKAN